MKNFWLDRIDDKNTPNDEELTERLLDLANNAAKNEREKQIIFSLLENQRRQRKNRRRKIKW